MTGVIDLILHHSRLAHVLTVALATPRDGYIHARARSIISNPKTMVQQQYLSHFSLILELPNLRQSIPRQTVYLSDRLPLLFGGEGV